MKITLYVLIVLLILQLLYRILIEKFNYHVEFGSLSDWLSISVSVVSLLFTVVASVLFVEQLKLQHNQLDSQQQQFAKQDAEESYRQALSIIEVTYGRLAEITKSDFYTQRIDINLLYPERFYSRRTNFRKNVKSFEDFYECLTDYEYSRVRSLVISIVNNTGSVLEISKRLNRKDLNRLLVSLSFDVIYGISPHFVLYVIVDMSLSDRGKTFDVEMGRFILDCMKRVKEVEYLFETTLIFPIPTFLDLMEKMSELNMLYISQGLKPLTPPNNPA